MRPLRFPLRNAKLKSPRRMATFEQLFPTFLQKCAELHELLRIVAFMLFIVGTILQVLHGFTGKTLILHMVRLFLLTALLVMLPQWGNEAQRILQTSILDGLGVDPSQVHDQYNHLLEVRRDTGNDRSWWDILGDIRAFTVEHIITGILWLVGQFASLLLFWAYIIQKFILFSAYALSPLLIGFMAIRPLRSIGSITSSAVSTNNRTMCRMSVLPVKPWRTKRIVPTMNNMNATMRSNSCSSAHFCRNVGNSCSKVAIRRGDLSFALRSWERSGRIHQAKRLPVFVHGLGELGVL